MALRRCTLVLLVLPGIVIQASCGTAVDSHVQRVSRSATFVVARASQVATASQAHWQFDYTAFIPPLAVEGVTLGSDGFSRSFERVEDGVWVRDAGNVYIANQTGKPMYTPSATISDVGSATGEGASPVQFGQLVYEYPDLQAGEGGPGPDGMATDGVEREWYYEWMGTETAQAYVDGLRYTVTVTWLTDP